ncbi:hypothetical protein CFBP5875_10300 [Agrobacterium pusense]|nr:hypothetical protein CFBP5875_10300 [Agrobacterium pusense]RSC36437.1 hypothetical protein EGT36_03440 [Agrobacterium sp. FDAARGOS_525]HAU77861.1 hypothetical protein [Agrobacterium sp.]
MTTSLPSRSGLTRGSTDISIAATCLDPRQARGRRRIRRCQNSRPRHAVVTHQINYNTSAYTKMYINPRGYAD